MKNKNGITLIALMITIIIMLILVGIVITMTIGENGIIRKAQMAGQNYLDATAQEENVLDAADHYLANNRDNGNHNNYSVEEQEIGTWVDGSKLYRKTVEITIPTADGEIIDLTDWNVKKIVNYYGVVKRSDNNYNHILDTDGFSIYINPDNTKLCKISTTAWYHNQPAIITIEYIKK